MTVERFPTIKEAPNSDELKFHPAVWTAFNLAGTSVIEFINHLGFRNPKTDPLARELYAKIDHQKEPFFPKKIILQKRNEDESQPYLEISPNGWVQIVNVFEREDARTLLQMALKLRKFCVERSAKVSQIIECPAHEGSKK